MDIDALKIPSAVITHRGFDLCFAIVVFAPVLFFFIAQRRLRLTALSGNESDCRHKPGQERPRESTLRVPPKRNPAIRVSVMHSP
ncbi:hypothetical protein [Lonsdalea quercina]|uniref:hypothetical protein n=1 Tax=Lonsdalea quercina TaxID=71657 RepID=UPI003976B296